MLIINIQLTVKYSNVRFFKKIPVYIIIIIIVFYLLAIIYVEEGINALIDFQSYPFGTEMGKWSIYINKYVYSSYSIISGVLLLVNTYFLYKKKYYLFFTFLILNIALFIYPILTFQRS